MYGCPYRAHYQGYRKCHDHCTEDDASHSGELHIPKRLTTMAYWVNQCHRLAESIDAPLFTTQVQEHYGTMMNAEPDHEITVKETLKLRVVSSGSLGRKG